MMLSPIRSLIQSFSRRSISRPVSQKTRQSRLSFDTLEAREVPANMTVTTLSDVNSRDSVLSIREAIFLNAGNLSYSSLTAAEKSLVSGTVQSNDRIVFSVTGTITLTASLPTINKVLRIEGPGASALTIDGDFRYRAFNVNGLGDATVSGIGIQHCFDNGSGGGAYNDGFLTLSRVKFYSCYAASHGGAIENNGNLNIDECWFQSNGAPSLGGAIDNDGTATITDTTFDFNHSSTGGAIWTGGGLTLKNCTFQSNYISTSSGSGGALRISSGNVEIVSCTFTTNECGTSGTGGAISASTSFIMDNSVVAYNERANGVRDDIAGTLVSSIFNFVSVNTGLSGISNGTNGNRVGTSSSPIDPMLHGLADNGGFGPTRVPKKGSDLLNGGASSALAQIRDARGAGRSMAITIGAVQVASPLAPVGPSSSLYGPGPINSSDEAFVKALYRACLLRDADGPGLAGWLDFLNGHPERRAQVAHGFYNSTENRSNQVTFFYEYFLGRSPDTAGLNGWVSVLQSGVDEAVVVRGFALSDEFTGTNNNTQFVNTIYYALLGRNPDTAGFNSWKNALDSNQLSRAQMIDGFLRSKETVDRVVIGYFQTYLGRDPNAGNVATWTNAIQAGATFGVAAEGFLGSNEFYNNGTAFVGV